MNLSIRWLHEGPVDRSSSPHRKETAFAHGLSNRYRCPLSVPQGRRARDGSRPPLSLTLHSRTFAFLERESNVTQATTPAERPRFVLTTQPYVHAPTAEDAWKDEPPGSHPVVQWAWTGQKGIEVGDLIAIYVSAPQSAICWLGRAISSAYANPRRTGDKEYWFWLEMTPLRDPVTFAEMRRDPRLSKWEPVVQKFRGRSRRVNPDPDPEAPDPYREWDALVDLADKKNPDVRKLVDDWSANAPEPFDDPDIDSYFWGAGVGDPYPFITEKQMQIALRDWAQDDLAYRTPAKMDPPLDLPMLEPILAPDSRADLLFGCLATREEPSEWHLWETKLLAGPSAIDQVLRYKAILKDMLPGQQIDPAVVAHTFSSTALRQAEERGVRCHRVRWGTDDEIRRGNKTPGVDQRGRVIPFIVDEDGNRVYQIPIMLENLMGDGSPAEGGPLILEWRETLENPLPDDET